MPQAYGIETAAPTTQVERWGPWLPGALMLLVSSVWILSPQADVDAIRTWIRFTARTSLFAFLMAYTAHAVWQSWPGHWTAWSRQHRRQWGLLLVTSHGLHLIGILAFLHLDPVGFHAKVPAITIYSGTIAYAFLVLMGVSSNDVVARWMGPGVWSRLHTWGSHYLWLSFLVAYGKRIPQDAIYWVPVVVLIAAQVLRQRAVHRTLQL